MKSFVAASAVLLAVASYSSAWGCGGYGSLPIDPVVESALSSDLRVAVPACIQLRALGTEGITRCRAGLLVQELRAGGLRAQLQTSHLGREKKVPSPEEFRSWRTRLERDAVRAESNAETLRRLIPALERAQRATAP